MNNAVLKFMLATVVLASACRNEILRSPVRENWTWYNVRLAPWLGRIGVHLPPSYDTLHAWIRYSDNRCDDYNYYRIQSKHFPLGEETGEWLLTGRPDSLYGLTIKHTIDTTCHKHMDKLIAATALWQKRQVLNQLGHSPPVLEDSIVADGHTVAYIATVDTMHNNRIQKLSAFTTCNGYPVVLEFVNDTRGYNKTNFFADCIGTLNDLRFDK